MGTPYSFKDSAIAIQNTELGLSFIMSGEELGIGSITLSRATENTVHDVAADGNVMPSYIAAKNGTIAIEAQQTSTINHFLTDLYNRCEMAADIGNVQAWTSNVITVRNTVDQTTHFATGVSFQKLPDKSYQQQGQRQTWMLMACLLTYETF